MKDEQKVKGGRREVKEGKGKEKRGRRREEIAGKHQIDLRECIFFLYFAPFLWYDVVICLIDDVV